MELGFFTIWPVIIGLLFGAVSQELQIVSVQGSTPVMDSQTSQTVTVEAGEKETQLARCLTAGGAKFYGAYWCPHCSEQKEVLGSALSLIDYVECDAKGTDPDPEACLAAGIEGYPTWQMPGKPDITGKQTFTELAAWSGCSY